MATRADFYVLHKDNKLEFLGSTSNEYEGPFSDARNEKDYRKAVSEMLKENQSEPAMWYWPWKNSKISDEVFVFRCQPNFFNKNKGSVYSKVHCKEIDKDESRLALLPYDIRYDMDDDDGYVSLEDVEQHLIIDLPTLKNK